MRKIVIAALLQVSLFTCLSVQAWWKEIPYKGEFTLNRAQFDVGSKDSIWAIAPKRVKKSESKKKGLRKKNFYLVKWDDRGKKWVKYAYIGQSAYEEFHDGKISAAPDGSVFVLEPPRASTKGPFTRPLLRFADGKLEKIYDFKSKKAKVASIAAASKNEIWLVRQKRHLVKNRAGQFEQRYETWIEKGDGSSFRRVGSKVQDVDQIEIGADGSVYLFGLTLEPPFKEFKLTMLKWDGAVWQPIDMKTKKVSFDLAVVGSDDIWFHEDYPRGIKFYRWNGKSLEKKGIIKAPPGKMVFPAKTGAAPGIVLATVEIINGDVKLYKWVEKDLPLKRK